MEQSRKLAEILPLESADMYYRDWKRATKDIRIAHVGTAHKKDLPCWSLAALLEAMPKYIRKYDGRVYRNYSLNLYRSYYHCCGYSFGSTTTDDDDNTLYCIGRDNWVDACYEMILKLHELNLL